MSRPFGSAIPVIPPEHPTTNESVWSAGVDIRKITHNGDITYEVEYQYAREEDEQISEQVRKCLNEFVQQLANERSR